MKKSVVAALGLAVLSTSAFASKTRMEALGQGTTSYYLNDTRSVFLNPAALNDMKNYIITEWGASAQADSQTVPRAEGGFFRETGAFAYGIYLGNNGAARTSAGSAQEFVQHQNSLDLMLAGDMGIKWGARLHYANSKDESLPAAGPFTRKNSALGLGFGVAQGNIKGSLNLDLMDKSSGASAAGDEWKRKPGIQLTGSYNWSSMTFFADVSLTNEEVKSATGGTLTGATFASGTTGTLTAGTAGSITHKTNSYTVGAARVHEINPGARIIADGRFVFSTDQIGGSVTTTQNGKRKTTKLPITLAVEADATSWLVLRGSVSQNVIFGSTKSVAGKTTTQANSTDVNAGATLNFGNLKVDGAIGTTDTTGTAGTERGVLSTSNLLTRVAVTYNF